MAWREPRWPIFCWLLTILSTRNLYEINKKYGAGRRFGFGVRPVGQRRYAVVHGKCPGQWGNGDVARCRAGRPGFDATLSETIVLALQESRRRGRSMNGHFAVQEGRNFSQLVVAARAGVIRSPPEFQISRSGHQQESISNSPARAVAALLPPAAAGTKA
jgi:hypothetical protein